MSDLDYKELDPFRKVTCDDIYCPNEFPANEMTVCEVCGGRFCPVCADTDLTYMKTEGVYVCKERCLNKWLENS